MAGSYQHCVTDAGELRQPDGTFNDMIENLGDAYEAIEEMYGMIWLLATERVLSDLEPEEIVEDAHQRYKEGLLHAPGPERPRS